jgi:hypothetical protein
MLVLGLDFVGLVNITGDFQPKLKNGSLSCVSAHL